MADTTQTILFTDLVGSTDVRTSLGDEPAHALFAEVDEVIRRQVDRFDGRIVKSMGDGVMAAFPVAARAVSCAAEIQRALRDRDRRRAGIRLAVRVGINTGDVISEEGDLHGHAVNAAARITAKAEGGEVLISEVTRLVAGSVEGVGFSDRGRFRLKGFPDRVRLHEVVWADAHPAAIPALERTAFVGRDRELAEVRRFLDSALRGSGGMVLVEGEPGMGKTRLADEVSAEARPRGALTFVGRAYDGPAAPYGALVEILEQALRVLPAETMREILGEEAPQVAKLLPEVRVRWPEVPQAFDMPAEQERRFLLNSLRDVLERAARATPLVLTFDDLQWADDSTVAFLLHAAERLPKAGVLVIGTIREGEVAPGSDLERARDALVRSRLAHLLRLGPLSAEGVGAMASAMAGRVVPEALTEALHAETAGNPFFVEEVFRHLAESGALYDESGAFRLDAAATGVIPDSVRVVIDRRLDRLGPRTRKLLTAAAVAGRASSLELLEGIGEVEGDALLDAVDEAERAGVLLAEGTGTDTRFAFAHELIRQTILAGLTAARRQQLHRWVAEALIRVHGERAAEHAAEIAGHLREAGSLADRVLLATYLRLAGERALEALDLEPALVHLEAAIELTPEEDARAHAILAFLLGTARGRLGDVTRALGDWSHAMELYASFDDADGMGRVAYEAGRRLGWEWRWPEAIDITNRALAAMGDSESGVRARLLAMAGVMLSWSGQPAEGAESLREATTLAERLDDPGALAIALGASAFGSYASLEIDVTIDTGQRAVPLLRDTGDLWLLCDMLPAFALAHVHRGRWDDALRIARESEELAERLGHAGARFTARQAQGFVRFIRSGDLAAFERFASEEAERARDIPFRSIGLASAAMGRFARGDFDGAAEDLEAAAAAEPPSAQYGFIAGLLAQVHGYRGDAARVDQVIEQHRWLLSLDRGTLGSLAFPGLAIEALSVLGRYEQAASLIQTGGTLLDRGSRMTWSWPRLNDTFAGIAEAAGEHWEDAEAHFGEALYLAHDWGVVAEQPEVRRFCAEMLLRRNATGDRELAETMLVDAVEQYRTIGMPRHVEMAESLLERARASTPVAAAKPSSEPSENAFRREGDFWTLAFGGETIRLKDSRGLQYLHRLLREPGREFHVLELASRGATAPDGDVGSILDDRAKASYKQRLADLAEELEEAESFSDPERAAKARAEIDALTEELSAAAGLGGRSRKTGSTAERARVAVRNAIASSLKAIERHHPELARHLRHAVKTGTFCSYAPERPVDWSF